MKKPQKSNNIEPFQAVHLSDIAYLVAFGKEVQKSMMALVDMYAV